MFRKEYYLFHGVAGGAVSIEHVETTGGVTIWNFDLNF
jgi:hypothetical protein